MLLRRSLLKVGVMMLILVLASAAAVLSRSSGRAAAATFGPVAEYAFDEGEAGGETVEDLAGENDGTLEGATRGPGRYGEGLSFDGQSSCVTVPNSESLQLSEEFTLEAWVKPEGNFTEEPIIFKEDENGPSYAVGIGVGASGKVEGYAEGEEITAPQTVQKNVWTYLAYTYDGNSMRLYVDGALAATKVVGNETFESEGPLRIGCWPGHEYFEGRIDEVRIYERTLGGAEVAADMEAPIQTPKRGPVADYSFDEDKGAIVEDVAGENEGTVEGATWTPHGRYGGAMEFDGEEDCVSIPNSASLQLPEEFTLEAWVRPISPLQADPIIYKESGSGYSYSMGLGYTQSGHLEGWAENEDEEQEHVVSAGSLEPGVWTHVAYTYDGHSMRLYVNGAVAAEKVVGAASFASVGPLWIGCSPNTYEYFGGRIDEPRVYERALDAAEVGADMEAPIQTPKAGPLAAYSFDEGVIGTEGGTVEDVSEHEHTATLEGGAGWAKGKYGGALDIPNEGCASVPDSPELDLSEEFTVEAWVRPEGGIYEDPVVVKESSGKDAFGIGLGSREEGYAEGFIGEGKGSKAAVGGERIRPYEWVHVAATWDGSKIRLYVDGELASTKAATTPPLSGEGSLRIGCDTPDGPFGGRIDEVRVYGRALNAAEVDGDMESPLQGPKRTPVAEYSFDEKNEETATDITGGGHTATVEDAKWTEHGKYGGAYEFKASEDDVLKIPASEELDFDEEFTLEAWVRPSGEDNESAPLIDKQEGGGVGYFLDEGGRISDRPEGAVEAEQEFIHAEDPLPADAWSFVTLTFDGNRTYLAVDGEPVANGAAEPVVTAEGELEIGGSTDTADYFDGRIDEVRIYDRALDQAEVGADMEAPIQTPKQEPVAAWSFDEGSEAGAAVEDITGDENEGTIEGATRTELGRYGGAIEFSGEESCVSVPNSESLQLAEGFTLEAWVRPEGSLSAAPLLFKEASGAYSYAMGIGLTSSSKAQGFIDPAGPGEEKEVTGSALEDDVWTHLAITYDGDHLRIYVNGELSESRAVGPLSLSSDGPLYIGCAPDFGEAFNGRIDEVRVYNRALVESEVVDDMGPHDSMYVATAENEGILTRAVGRITYSTSGDQQQRSVPHFSLSVSYLGPVPPQIAAATRLSGGDDVREVEGRQYLFKECPYAGGSSEVSHGAGDDDGRDVKRYTGEVANEGEIKRGCPLHGALNGSVAWTIEVLGTIRYDRGVIVEAENGPTCHTRANPEYEKNEEKLRREIKEEPTKEKEISLEELELNNPKPELAKNGCFASPPGGGTRSTNGIDLRARWHWNPAGDCTECLDQPILPVFPVPQACGEQVGHIPIYPPKTKKEETITREEHFYVFESRLTPEHVQGCDWSNKMAQRSYRDLHVKQ
jgi:hypothetical protein